MLSFPQFWITSIKLQIDLIRSLPTSASSIGVVKLVDTVMSLTPHVKNVPYIDLEFISSQLAVVRVVPLGECFDVCWLTDPNRGPLFPQAR